LTKKQKTKTKHSQLSSINQSASDEMMKIRAGNALHCLYAIKPDLDLKFVQQELRSSRNARILHLTERKDFQSLQLLPHCGRSGGHRSSGGDKTKT